LQSGDPEAKEFSYNEGKIGFISQAPSCRKKPGAEITWWPRESGQSGKPFYEKVLGMKNLTIEPVIP
jgi:hypothetical protein